MSSLESILGVNFPKDVIINGVTNNSQKVKDGFVFWNFVLLLGLGRFLINFYRVDSRLYGLSEGQYLGIVMFLVGGFVLLRYYFKDLKKLF